MRKGWARQYLAPPERIWGGDGGTTCGHGGGGGGGGGMVEGREDEDQ